MNRERFARLATGRLEAMASSLDDDARKEVAGVTEARVHELRVAAHVVRDLSRAAENEEAEDEERHTVA